MLNVSLNQQTITIILLAGLLHWVNMSEITLNVSLNQHTVTIILLAELLDWVNMIEIRFTIC